jgi:Uma2 family endonuclease
MSQLAPRLAFSFDDYLEWENRQPHRHEFIRGEVFAMAGGTDLHNQVAGNLYVLLHQRLRGSPCRVFMADVKVRVESADCGFYPDLLVTCAESDRADRLVKRSPILIVEVLSPGTATFDMGNKFAAYRQLDSLQEYVLIDPTRVWVQIYRRQNGQWLVDSVGAGASLRLESIDLDCPVAAIYEDLSEPPMVGFAEPERRL